MNTDRQELFNSIRRAISLLAMIPRTFRLWRILAITRAIRRGRVESQHSKLKSIPRRGRPKTWMKRFRDSIARHYYHLRMITALLSRAPEMPAPDLASCRLDLSPRLTSILPKGRGKCIREWAQRSLLQNCESPWARKGSRSFRVIISKPHHKRPITSKRKWNKCLIIKRC